MMASQTSEGQEVVKADHEDKAGLLNLPRELFIKIMESTLEHRGLTKELSHLRLVCKSFDAIILPMVWKDVTLVFARLREHSDPERTAFWNQTLERIGDVCLRLRLDFRNALQHYSSDSGK
jgi:hypothetical protein